jgi:hypothetical protein
MQCQTPRIAGVAGGVGTTLLATALRGLDNELYGGGPVDVLVCRSTVTSLEETHRLIELMPCRPVLAVAADIPAYPPKPVRELIRMSLPYFHSVVAVPFVQRWRGLSGDYLTPEAANILDPQVAVPHELRDFAKAMQTLARAVAPLLPAGAPTETTANAARRGVARHEPPAAPVIPPLPPEPPARISRRVLVWPSAH